MIYMIRYHMIRYHMNRPGKNLEEEFEKFDSSPNVHSHLASKFRLSANKVHEEVQWHAKYEVSIKVNYYKRSRRQKEKTHWVSELFSEEIQSLSLSPRRNPLFLVIHLFLASSHPTPSSIHISLWSVKSFMAIRG